MLHHIITVGLIVFSFFNNYVRIGSLVLLIHDVSDIFGALTKVTMHCKYEIITIFNYIGMLSLWIYFRLYVYPFKVIRSALKQVPYPHHEKNIFLILLMSSLVVLHVYWFITFVILFINYALTSEVVNGHEEGFDKLKIGKEDYKNKLKSKNNLKNKAIQSKNILKNKAIKSKNNLKTKAIKSKNNLNTKAKATNTKTKSNQLNR